MTKGDDALKKKRNKANRKKQRQNDSSSVSNRVAAIIASKKRRKSGKRRLCQGMCFSLPTPEDPFNDGHEKWDLKSKETKKSLLSKVDCEVKHLIIKKNMAFVHSNNAGQKIALQPEKANLQLRQTGAAYTNQVLGSEQVGCPSKFLILCLNSMENELRHNGLLSNEEGKPLFVDTWGVEFWKCYSTGKNVLDTSGSSSTVEQIAWIASTAADDIVRKEKEGLSLTSPFLLYLVPSQEKAIKVRAVCKPLKGLGIHTVSLHPGASVDHQIHGLKSCEPEFLVSTPERLLELVSLKAIDISGVSFLVVDGLEMLIQCACFDTIKSITQLISANPQTVVFNDSLDNASHLALQHLLGRSLFHRLSFDDSITSQGACITQSIYVCASEEEQLSK